MMVEKEINDYVINEVIMTAKKSVPFIPTDLMKSFPLNDMPPFDGGGSIEAQAYASLSIFGNIDRQIIILLREGYIKKLLDNTNQYILTEKGEKAQDEGSIENYKRKQNSKDKWDKYLRYAGYTLPLITLASLFVSTLSYYKKTDTFITNEIKIDSSLIKKDVIRLFTKDSNNTNKNDSSNSCNKLCNP